MICDLYCSLWCVEEYAAFGPEAEERLAESGDFTNPELRRAVGVGPSPNEVVVCD